MRKMLMVTAAALVLGAASAIAAPLHSGPGSGGARGMAAGPGGGGVPHGAMTAAPNASIGARMPAQTMGSNVRANNFVPRTNRFAAGPNRPWNRQHYAYSGRDHDHDRWHRHHYWGGGWGGLYAYEPGYDYDYYADNSCYQPRWVPTPYGWRWRDVWVCD